MAELFKIAVVDVKTATERAFYKVMAEKGLNYEKLSALVGRDPSSDQEYTITDRAIKAYALEGNTPPLTKAILITAALDEFKPGLGATFLNEILKVVGYKVIPTGKSNDNEVLGIFKAVIDSIEKGRFDEMKAMNN